MAVVLMIAVSFVTTARNTTDFSNERSFAVQKAISLVEEVRNFTQQVGDFAELDVLDDGTVNNPVLTIHNVVTPADAVSGNLSDAESSTGWRYSRRLEIRPIPGANIRDLRIVTAYVYRELPNNVSRRLADVSTVLRSPGNQAFPTTQTYDVYLLAMENIPGWWVYMANIRPLIEGRVSDLQARNPGLEFRAHWITKSSYGRNMRYTPFINRGVDSYEDVNYAYFYPGTMPAGSAASHYYVPHQIDAQMNVDETVINDYDAVNNPFPYTLADEYNHGMRYIDELRLFNNRCQVDVDPPLEDPMTPTWRILLEKMCTDPESFENAILINLHGELLPMPAMRNYSDACRDPENLPGVRVVTHPRYLCTPMDYGNLIADAAQQETRDLQLRVYAYKDLCDPNLGAIPDTVDQFSVTIQNVDLSFNVNEESYAGDPSLIVKRIYGGVDDSYNSDGDLNPDKYGLGEYTTDAELHFIGDPTQPPPDHATLPDNRMCYHVWCDDDNPGDSYPGNTVITFYNTPTICPPVEDLPTNPGMYQGLPDGTIGLGWDDWRLYGLEYVPSSTEEGEWDPVPANIVRDFSRDLTDNTNNPKNTARWIIEIPDDVMKTPAMRDASGLDDELFNPYDGLVEVDHRLTIQTVLGDGTDVEQYSTTYAWWTDDPTKVPFTERSQFIGDPRHCPYADLKDTALVHWTYNGIGATPYSNHYNWWFCNFRNSARNVFNNWRGYSQTRIENDESDDNDGWSDYHFRIDAPRLLEVLRTALVSTDSVYTTLTGYCYFYMGIGNEIGYDSANGFSKGIPVSRKPFYGASGNRTEQNMVPWAKPDDYGTIGYGMKLIKQGRSLGNNYWWGKHWIGDLYPDSQWTFWRDNGNIPAGAANDEFVRFRRDWISEDLPLGTTFTYERRCMREEGCNSCFMIGNRSNTFYHNYSSGTGGLTAAGTEIADGYAYPLPGSASISRPFRIDWGGSSGWKSNPDFDFTTDFPHGSAELVRTYYTHPWSAPNGLGSALVAMNQPNFNINDPDNDSTSFQVINGLDKTLESGSSFIATWSILSLVHSFLTAGEPATATLPARRIEQLPRVEIRQPTIITELDDPDQITVQWSSEFLRWDGELYTQYYPDGFYDPDWNMNLRYVLLYSNDGGDTWYYMESDAGAPRVEATLGRRPEGSEAVYLRPDIWSGADEFFTWAVPAALFPEGSYLIRTECYRDNKALHFSQHMEKIFIDR
jgi:hypothetical protein